MNGVLVLVAVRMKSARLPKKAICDLAGEPLIVRLMQRLSAALTPEAVVMCTSTHPQDDPLADLARQRGWDFHRGHEFDVMQRFLDVAQARKAHTVVRVTGDNPLTDPPMLDHMVATHLAERAEYSCTEDLPRGTRCEVIDAEALARCHRLATDPNSSEYMTLMIRRPDHFRVACVGSPWPALRRPELRLTVDTPEDYALVRAIYDAFDGCPPELARVIEWIDRHPAIAALNVAVRAQEIDDNINVRLRGD